MFSSLPVRSEARVVRGHLRVNSAERAGSYGFSEFSCADKTGHKVCLKMRHSGIIDKIKPIVFDILQDNGMELVDITYRRESAGNVLRISLDTEAGITIDECVSMNKVISNALDESGIMEDKYILEVASPGLDRPLKSKNDFLKARGKMIRVHTYMAIDSKREFTGIMGGASEKDVSIVTINGAMVTISFDKISSAKLHF